MAAIVISQTLFMSQQTIGIEWESGASEQFDKLNLLTRMTVD